MSMRPDRRPDLALIAPYPPAGRAPRRPQRRRLVHRQPRPRPRRDRARRRGRRAGARGRPGRVHRRPDRGAPELPDGPAGAAAARCAPRPSGSRRVVHLQFELFLYGGPTSLVGLVPALGAARRTLGDAAARDDHAPGRRAVDRSTAATRGCTASPAPAVVARNGIAGVQSAISRAGAATIVHEEPFKRILPAATVIPHGIEDVAPIDRATARAAHSASTIASSCCASASSPRTRASSSCSRRPAACAPTSRSSSPAASTRGWPTGDGFGAELRERYGDVARFTGWVPDGDVAALVRRRRPRACSRTRSRSRRAACSRSPSPTARRCCCRRRWPAAPARRASLTSPMTAGPLARPHRAAGRRSRCPRRAAREWSGVLAAGRRWPAVAEQHARLYEEVLDVDRHARRRVRAG